MFLRLLMNLDLHFKGVYFMYKTLFRLSFLSFSIFIIFISFQSCATVTNFKNNTPNQDRVITVTKTEYIEGQKLVFLDRPYYVVIDKNAYNNLSTDNKYAMNNYMAYNDTVIYNYFDTMQYIIYGKVGAITDIILEPGEEIIGDVLLSDPVRFIVGTTYNLLNNIKTVHFTIKPAGNAIANIIVTTTRRSYNFKMIVDNDKYNAIVKFYYPIDYSNKDIKYADVSKNVNNITNTNNNSSDNNDNIKDDNKYNLDYSMKYYNKNIKWLPKLIYDDGKNVYIIFRDDIKYYTFPAISDKDGGILNYDVKDNMIVLYNMHDSFKLFLEKDVVYVDKKK